jgi:alkanesulfonate monooxygenase SsuD/methylene tetrahydromethanopterin reductase-like flavin-dependent oxidoreductase (luciferase family)
MRGMRVGVVILPETTWSVQQTMWKRVEDIGFDHAWTYDHLAWGALRDAPWHAAVPTLATAALATSNIRIGPLVASPNFRHPVPFARELVTLDDISNGRITLGIGSGSPGWDATIMGDPAWPPRERADRFAEFVALLDRLLREREVSADGRYYRADEARTYPGCVQEPRIPFAVAATGPRGFRLAARVASMWVTTGAPGYRGPLLGADAGISIVRDQMKGLDAACEAEGRDPSSIDRLVLTGPSLDGGLASRDAFARVRDTYAAAGVTDLVVHWPRPTDPYGGDEAVLELIEW